MTTRRSFLAAALGQGAALPLLSDPTRHLPAWPGTRKKKVLIIGGTRFVGPAFVEAARARGMELTLFNRGRSNPTLFRDLPLIQGDRNKDLSALQEGRWDAVLDTCGYFPQQVQRMAKALGGRVGQYLFVSSASVYHKVFAGLKVAKETSKLDPLVGDPEQIRRITNTNYGPLKALCEKAAEAAFPGKATLIRPGYIVGPRDNSDRFGYWAHRFRRGGEILAPGDPRADFQVIDVRDLGAWMVHAIEQQIHGAFNTVGFDHRISVEEMLHGWKVCSHTGSSLTWVDDAFLAEHKQSSWGSLPGWIPAAEYTRLDPRKAITAGLRLRPLGDTLRDTYAWELNQRPRALSTRRLLQAEREAALLAAWKKR